MTGFEQIRTKSAKQTSRFESGPETFTPHPPEGRYDGRNGTFETHMVFLDGSELVLSLVALLHRSSGTDQPLLEGVDIGGSLGRGRRRDRSYDGVGQLRSGRLDVDDRVEGGLEGVCSESRHDF